MLPQIALVLHMDSTVIRLDESVFKYDNPLLGANAIVYCIDTAELHLLLYCYRLKLLLLQIGCAAE